MSSVPEVTVARQVGMKVLGLSLVTNMCVSEFDAEERVNHEAVLETGRRRARDMESLLSNIVEQMDAVPLKLIR